MARELFPIINPRLVETEETSLPLLKEVAWDFINHRPKFLGGRPVIVEGDEAVKVWVWKAILTQRMRYKIYTSDYGSELETLIGQEYSEDTKRAEAIRYTREAIENFPYIRSIENITVDFHDGTLTIYLELETVYGEVKMNVRS